MTKRITEIELVLPALYLMQINDGGISTSELQSQLRSILKPKGEDLEILSGRKDDKFSQKVRNLKAHDTFERFGFAKYTKPDNSKVGIFTISDAGKKHLASQKDILKYLLNNNFNYEDIKSSLTLLSNSTDKNKANVVFFDENITILEGEDITSQKQTYTRSKELRKFALEHFTINGVIACNCCNFDFSTFYGKTLGSSFIEIHHIKPIFQYSNDEFEKTLSTAMANLLPVCSNCHRMIHRNWSNPLSPEQLKEAIKENGTYITAHFS